MKKLMLIALLGATVGGAWSSAGPEHENPDKKVGGAWVSAGPEHENPDKKVDGAWSSAGPEHENPDKTLDRAWDAAGPEHEQADNIIPILGKGLDTFQRAIIKVPFHVDVKGANLSFLVNELNKNASVHFNKEVKLLKTPLFNRYVVEPESKIIGITVDGVYKKIEPLKTLPAYSYVIKQNGDNYLVSEIKTY